MCEHRVMNRRRNALADIFAGLSPEKVEQLQRYVNTDSGFEEESSTDPIDTTTTTDATHTTSTPLNRCTDQSNPIDIPNHASLNNTFYDQITTNFLAFRDFASSSEDTASDDEVEDERFVKFINSPRYRQRRLGIVENVFRENLNMMNGILASH